MMARKVKVADVGQVLEGQCRLVQAGDVELVVHHMAGKYYATEPLCPHRGMPLSEGFLDGTNIICRYHGWTFDVPSGASTNIPNVCLKTYPVTVEGAEIFVELEKD